MFKELKFITLLVCFSLLVFGSGCSTKPEAYAAYEKYVTEAAKPSPMFELETHEGQDVKIELTGVKSVRMYYPEKELAPFVDTTAQANAQIATTFVNGLVSVGGPLGIVLGMGNMVTKIAPMFGSGNVQVNQNAVGGAQDSRLSSPDNTHPPTIVRPEVVSPVVVQP